MSRPNILFDVRHHATHTQEFEFAITVIAERLLLPFPDLNGSLKTANGERGSIDLDRSFKSINSILKDKVEELQKVKK